MNKKRITAGRRNKKNNSQESDLTFVAVIAHQMKGPLSKIRWSSEILLDEDMGPLNKNQKELTHQIHADAMKINETIALAVSIMKAESGEEKIQLQKFDLRKISLGTVKELDYARRGKNLAVVVSAKGGKALKAVCDERMVKQALFNLLANAIHYSKPGGKIEMAFSRNAREIVASVRDQGIGIPRGQERNIFKKFFRADNARKKSPEGFGLGLFFTKLLVTTWGGRIWFESEEGRGSTFYFTIPVIKS